MILFAFVLFALLVAGWLVAPKSAVNKPVKSSPVVEALAPRLHISESPA